MAWCKHRDRYNQSLMTIPVPAYRPGAHDQYAKEVLRDFARHYDVPAEKKAAIIKGTRGNPRQRFHQFMGAIEC